MGKNGTPPSFTYGYTTGTDWVGSVTSGSYARTNTLLGNRRVLDIVETKWGAAVRSKYDSTFGTTGDNRGLRSTVVQSGTIPTAGTTTFTYNERAELTGASFSADANKSFTWGYDMMGKRTSATVNTTTTNYTAADADKDVNQYATITGESGLAYDKDGNMTQDGTWHYRYDGENRLKEMEKKDGTKTLQFVYDYLNRRVRKTVRNGTPAANVASSTKFVWSGWQLTAELDAGTSETGTTHLKSYLWGLDFSNGSGAAGGAGALLGVYQGGAWYHTAYDAMGNLTGYLNSTTGGVVASYEYNAYGQIIASTGSATSFAFGFATQYTDRESDLVYYGLRYYQPKHGRFINRDPIEEAGGLNLYSFTGNSPSNRWDVLGLELYIVKGVLTGAWRYFSDGAWCIPSFKDGAIRWICHDLTNREQGGIGSTGSGKNAGRDGPGGPGSEIGPISPASVPAPDAPDPTNQWQPNKKDCDELRNGTYGYAFSDGTRELDVDQAAVAAAYQVGVAIEKSKRPDPAQAYEYWTDVMPDGRFLPPTQSVKQTGGPFTPRTGAVVHVHGHNIGLQAWRMGHGQPEMPEAEYLVGANSFSPTDVGSIMDKKISYSYWALYTDSGRIVKLAREDNPRLFVHNKGRSATFEPVSDETRHRIFQCLLKGL